MKFIIEGVDGSGKSTLAKKIIDTFPFIDFEIVHFTRETANNFEMFKSYLDDGKNYIFDRFCYGQFVYQSEKERIDNGWMSNRDLMHLECIINERRDIECIYVNTPDDTCLYNCHNNGEDEHYTLDYIRDLKERYDKVIQSSKVKWRIFDNNFENPYHSSNVNYLSLPHIVAVDFDKCLADTDFPHIKNINYLLIKDLIHGKYKDSRKILWTTRTGNALKEAVDFLKDYGFVPDAINDNVKEIKDLGLNPRKVYANLYLDDSAVQHFYKNRTYIKSNDLRELSVRGSIWYKLTSLLLRRTKRRKIK